MDHLSSSLHSLDLSKKKDVTSEFFRAIDEIAVGDIVKSPIFPLLHGTHALEIGNTRLDSYILPEVEYQRGQLTQDQVLGISTGLVRALACWLGDNVSLSNTLLGYQPLCDILDKYALKHNLDFIGRSGSWDDICDCIVVGVIGCVNVTLDFALQGVVYEDEDITTRTMDLDWFVQLPTQSVLDVLNRVSEWTDNKTILKIVAILNCWINFKFLINVQYKNDPSVLKPWLSQISTSLADIEYLTSITDLGTEPENCFNTNALRKYNNYIPPKPVVKVEWLKALENMKEMFEDTIDVLEITSNFSSMLQLKEWLLYLANKRHQHSQDEVLGLHVVPRMLLQLFLIRNDESIIGDEDYLLNNLIWDYIKQFTMANSPLDINFEDQISHAEAVVMNLKVTLNQLITGVSQNPSRQRQILTKNVLFWDKFQSEFPQLEFDFNKVLPDVNIENQKPLMPLTSFIYFEKLEKMIHVILQDIELNLLKDVRELTNGYFVLIFFIDHILNHINGMSQLYEYRKRQLESYPKKLKKLNGQKRNHLKSEYEHCQRNFVIIEQTLQYWIYKSNFYKVLKCIAEIKLTTCQVLSSIGYGELPPLAAKRVSKESLYHLQWKNFNSIADPSIPQFKQLDDSLKSFSKSFEQLVKEDKISRVNMLVDNHAKIVSSLITENESIIRNLRWSKSLTKVTEDELLQLKRETVVSKLELSKILATVTSTDKSLYTLDVVRLNRHRYFPGFNLQLKQ